MGEDPQPFKGIISCFPTFSHQNCSTKTIQFAISSILIVFGLIILVHQIRNYGLKARQYTTFAMIFMVLGLITNLIYCFWNEHYQLYSLQTYFNNLYFLTIVAYVCQAYILKSRKINLNSNESVSQSEDQSYILNANQTQLRKWKYVYYVFVFIALLAYTLIFITAILGTINDEQHLQQEMTSFLKNSCEEIWYLCVNAVCILLSFIVLIVLCKNNLQEKQKIRKLSLSSIESKNSKSSSSSKSSSNQSKSSDKINNPLQNLWIWMGLNIFGQCLNLVQSGLLLGAQPSTFCRIIVDNDSNNNILMLIFVILTMDLQYASSIWFYFPVKKKIIQKKQVLLQIQNYSDSYNYNIGNIQQYIPSKSSSIQVQLS